MNALFFNIPAYGHVNPSLPLVTALTRRGHTVTYYNTERFRAVIESAGAQFQPYAAFDDAYIEAHKLDGTSPNRIALELMRLTARVLPSLIDEVNRLQPDVIIYDGLAPWGFYLAQIVRLPSVVSLAILPLVIPSSAALVNLSVIGAVVSMMLSDIQQGVKAWQLAKTLAQQYAIKPLAATQLLNAPGDLAISYTSAAFQANAKSVPHVRFVGRELPEYPLDPSFSFDAVRGRRVIYISLGTVNNQNVDFFRACIQAFAHQDVFVIISTGGGIDADLFAPLPDNIALYDWVAQTDVLARASLFITHGGLNSIHDGLGYGVPLLLVPQQGEQTMNALRVVELGAGLRIHKKQVTPERLRADAKRVLDDPRFHKAAADIGATFRAAGGVRCAADAIERLVALRG